MAEPLQVESSTAGGDIESGSQYGVQKTIEPSVVWIRWILYVNFANIIIGEIIFLANEDHFTILNFLPTVLIYGYLWGSTYNTFLPNGLSWGDIKRSYDGKFLKVHALITLVITMLYAFTVVIFDNMGLAIYINLVRASLTILVFIVLHIKLKSILVFRDIWYDCKYHRKTIHEAICTITESEKETIRQNVLRKYDQLLEIKHRLTIELAANLFVILTFFIVCFYKLDNITAPTVISYFIFMFGNLIIIVIYSMAQLVYFNHNVLRMEVLLMVKSYLPVRFMGFKPSKTLMFSMAVGSVGFMLNLVVHYFFGV